MEENKIRQTIKSLPVLKSILSSLLAKEMDDKVVTAEIINGIEILNTLEELFYSHEVICLSKKFIQEHTTCKSSVSPTGIRGFETNFNYKVFTAVDIDRLTKSLDDEQMKKIESTFCKDNLVKLIWSFGLYDLRK